MSADPNTPTTDERILEWHACPKCGQFHVDQCGGAMSIPTDTPTTAEMPLRHDLTLAQYLLFEAILEGNRCEDAECKRLSEHCECWREFCELRGSI